MTRADKIEAALREACNLREALCRNSNDEDDADPKKWDLVLMRWCAALALPPDAQDAEPYIGEEWELLAMALCEEEGGADSVHQLLWQGGAVPRGQRVTPSAETLRALGLRAVPLYEVLAASRR